MIASYKVYLMGFRVFVILALLLSAFGPWQTTQVFADKLVCGIPGKEGPVTLANGVVNTYYPGVGTASATATSISVGSSSGAAQTIQAGDLLLVIQMQGADINSTNTGAYGDDVAGDPATGNLASNFTAGLYEYVIATNAVGAGGGTLTISSGLLNSYSTQNYPVGAGNQGQRRFQVIRVPQYSSATITATVTSLPWNGSVGGVVALDVAGSLNFSGGSINVNGQGFRGGGAVNYDGGGGGSNTDYRLLSSVTANSSKGEGIAGTPRFIFNGTTVVDLGALLEGYPDGSFGRGAPGNAGGGGTDGNQVANDENTGGGGGGNGGTGGKGGFAWNSVVDSGGFGGGAFPATPARLTMGGGGGAGTINDNNPLFSSGGIGGGIVIVRAGTVTGNGTVNANGADGQDQPLNDSGGGAGAGGSVLVLAQNGALPAALNVNANGGTGGDAWLTEPPPGATYPGERHGPGGGGGGGVIYLSSIAGALSAAGGANGLTTTANDNYGSTPGSVGIINTGLTPSQTTTSISGAGCIPTPSVVKTTSTPIVAQTPTGASGTYTIVVSIPANQGTALGFEISDTLPTGFTYDSTTSINLSGGATRVSISDPTAGDMAPSWGSFDIPGGGQVQITFVVEIDASVPAGTYQNPATAIYTDPTRTVPNGTTSTSYDSASSPGEDITVTTTAGPALTIVKSVTQTSYTTVGAVLNYSYLVTNTGNVILDGPFTVTDDRSTDESCPATATLAPGAFITCTASYTVTQADITAGSVTNIASAHGSFGGVPVDSPTDSETVNYVAAPTSDLSLTKVVNNSSPLVGANVTFTVTVTNVGPDPATGVQVGDLLPAGFAFVSANPSTGTYTSGTGVWNIGALAVNTPVTLTITATVNPTGPYMNTAEVTASNQVDPDSTPNNNNPNEDDQASVTVTPAQGNVSKSVNIASARLGEIVTYDVQAVIPSGTFNNVTLVDTMDRGLSFFACDGITAGGLTTTIVDPAGLLTPFQFICANPTVDSNGSADPVDVGRRVTFDFGTVTNSTGADQILTVTYRAVVLDNAGNQNGVNVNNSALVSWTGSNNPPASSTVGIVEPDLSISKTSNNTFIANGTTVTFFITIQHTAASTADAFDVVVADVLPNSLDFVAGSLDCTLGAQDPTPASCTYNAGTRTISATWDNFTRLGGTGQIRFQAAGNANLPANGSVTNIAAVEWTSLPGDLSQPQSANQFSTERYYDPNDPNLINTFGASASLLLSPLGGGGSGTGGGGGTGGGANTPIAGGFLIPVTGFAPGVVTELMSPQPSYSSTELKINIPALDLTVPVVGVQLKNGTWDVSWLWGEAGWLQKTAYPTFPGNSVVTAHDVNADGAPGPFSRIKQLRVGDYIFVELDGYRYTYEVVSNSRVSPTDISILRHEEKSWLTLVTCDKYDVKTGTHLKRVVVRTVLIDVDIK
jgi:LPXTG-site transpeptidase (sortase) family protein